MRNRFAAMAVIVLTIVFLVGIFAPLLAPYSPTNTVPKDRLLPPGSLHYFGTDELGRDIFTRVLYGTRVSVGIALFAILLSALVGTFIGSFSGFIGRWIDQIIMRG